MQVRKSRIPSIVNATIQKKEVLCEGNNSISKITLKERTGRIRRLVTRRRLSLPWERGAIEYQQKLQVFRKMGLPVPAYSKVDLRKKSPTYLHIFQPNLERKHGKLTPVNLYTNEQAGRPVFLGELTLAKDRALIGKLAEDLVKLNENGYVSHWIDFWHFYKKQDSYERLIFDIDELHKAQGADHSSQVSHMFHEIGRYLKREEFSHFVREYIAHCKNKKLATFVEQRFVEKPVGYYSRKEYYKRERAGVKEIQTIQL